ncbi:T-complex protein 1 subunit eta [Clonorchis sinensis]|uniref:T-complex protein 1 subunit eta n=1 Tax=Clonorchis sinensis TaxID=79923 RepID=H2KVM2_CLOSI|nr:T-complex protein 1 subunit eta [Clonorchis sinensis]
MIIADNGKTTISNDGATILKLLDIVHPAAKTLVDIARAQDAEVGDGTTSVVVLATEFLKQAKPFLEEGVHPTVIIRAFRIAEQMALKKLSELACRIKSVEPSDQRALLEKCAATALSSKMVAGHKDFFAKLTVDAVSQLDSYLPLKMIGIKKPIDSGAFTQLAPPMRGYLPHLPKSSADETVAATTTVRQV